MKILREPLVHFLVLGALLFGVFHLWGNSIGTGTAPTRIEITPGQIENLRVSFVRQFKRAPAPGELDAQIQSYIREEILVREAEALGLDKDDPAVRGQLARRMEFLYEDQAETKLPTNDDLRQYLAQHSADFKRSDGSAPAPSDVQDAVQSAWLAARQKSAVDAAYQKLKERYTIVIDLPVPTAPAGPEKSPATEAPR